MQINLGRRVMIPIERGGGNCVTFSAALLRPPDTAQLSVNDRQTYLLGGDLCHSARRLRVVI